MARYIDADKLITFANNHKNKMIDANDMARFPAADVVPKSKVDRLRFNLQAVLEEIPETKREFAKEIFEEIDGITDLFAKGLIGELEMYDKLAELKKKYTESEGNI